MLKIDLFDICLESPAYKAGLSRQASGKLYTLLAIAVGIALWVLVGRLLRFYLKNKKAEEAQAAVSIPASE